tara:strand:- start:129 stop:338 length:210 start_codon:yes stop_codon:yes gene_type:complete
MFGQPGVLGVIGTHRKSFFLIKVRKFEIFAGLFEGVLLHNCGCLIDYYTNISKISEIKKYLAVYFRFIF